MFPNLLEFPVGVWPMVLLMPLFWFQVTRMPSTFEDALAEWLKADGRA